MRRYESQGTEFNPDIFHPDDAEGVAALFRSVYGEGYPVKVVYDPAALVAAFEKRENTPVVARVPSKKNPKGAGGSTTVYK
jgi:hypothetical protein